MADQKEPGQMPGNSYVPQPRGLGKPVDRSQERYRPSPHYSRGVPPHTGVSAGEEDPREHSLTSQVLVYGGMALAAAAVTAGGVLAVRKVVDLVTGDDDDHPAPHKHRRPKPQAPRFADMSEREREAMRQRARARAAADGSFRAQRRDEALETRRPAPRADQDERRREDRRPQPPRAPRPQQRASNGTGFLGEIEHTAQSLTQNLNSVVGAVTAAMAAFRSVADQAEGVVRQFHGTADGIRSFLGDPNRRSADDRNRFRRPARREVVDLRDDGAAEENARTHRL